MKIKKIIVFFIILILITSVSVISNASYSYLDKFSSDTSSIAFDKTTTTLGKSLQIIQIIAMAVAIIMLMVIAIKYMFSSVSERAEMKKYAVVYVIGALIMFGASGILEIIKDFAVNI